MNTGYVLFCNKKSLTQCLSRRLFACEGEYAGEVKMVPKGAVLFVYNGESKTLIGPFTAASKGASKIETGTWNSEIDLHSASANVKLEWEDLHIMENAGERFPFLRKPETCMLSSMKVQTLLAALKEAPKFQG